MATIPPEVDGDLIPWSLNFSTRITATPTVFDLTASDATAYAALHADFVARAATAENPGTRTKANVQEKNLSKRALLAKARQFAKIIKANPDLTDGQLTLLGLAVRDVIPTPAPIPTSRPLLVVDPFGNLDLRDETTPLRRGKPRQVFGSVVFAAILPAGSPAPETPAQAHYAGVATKSKFNVPVTSEDGGKMLYVMARYINSRGEAGPVSAVVASRIAA